MKVLVGWGRMGCQRVSEGVIPGGNEKNSCDVKAWSVTSSSIRKIVTSRAIATAVSLELCYNIGRGCIRCDMCVMSFIGVRFLVRCV